MAFFQVADDGAARRPGDDLQASLAVIWVIPRLPMNQSAKTPSRPSDLIALFGGHPFSLGFRMRAVAVRS